MTYIEGNNIESPFDRGKIYLLFIGHTTFYYEIEVVKVDSILLSLRSLLSFSMALIVVKH